MSKVPGDADTHARIARGLAVPAALSPESPPHPYLRRHLVTHAAVGGVLDDQTIPAAFLPWQSDDTVRASLGLPITPHPRRVGLIAWACIEPYLNDASLESRSDSLVFALRRCPATLLPVIATASLPSMTPLIVRWRKSPNIIAALDYSIHSLVAFTDPDNCPRLATASSDYPSIENWDPETETQIGETLTGHPHTVTAMVASTGSNGAPCLATGSEDGTVRP